MSEVIWKPSSVLNLLVLLTGSREKRKSNAVSKEVVWKSLSGRFCASLYLHLFDTYLSMSRVLVLWPLQTQDSLHNLSGLRKAANLNVIRGWLRSLTRSPRTWGLSCKAPWDWTGAASSCGAEVQANGDTWHLPLISPHRFEEKLWAGPPGEGGAHQRDDRSALSPSRGSASSGGEAFPSMDPCWSWRSLCSPSFKERSGGWLCSTLTGSSTSWAGFPSCYFSPIC